MTNSTRTGTSLSNPKRSLPQPLTVDLIQGYYRFLPDTIILWNNKTLTYVLGDAGVVFQHVYGGRLETWTYADSPDTLRVYALPVTFGEPDILEWVGKGYTFMHLLEIVENEST